MKSNNYIYNQLSEITDRKNIFSFIVSELPYQHKETTILPFWGEILSYLKHAYEHEAYNKKDLPKIFHSKKQFKIFEDLGIDYNYIDRGGNNFLHYLVSELNYSSREDNRITFLENALDYILTKTENIYHINHGGKNILANMMGLKNAGFKGEHFFAFIKKYPDFNFHQVSQEGQNLLNFAIQDGALEVAKFLIKQNVDIYHLDNRNCNLLYAFQFLGGDSKQLHLFDSLLLKLDITQPSIHSVNLVDNWLKWTCDDKTTNAASKNTWVNHIAQKIIEQEFFYTPQSLEILRDTFKQYQSSYTQFCHREIGDIDERTTYITEYNNALITLSYIRMDNIIPHNNTDNLARKIKI